MQKLIHLAVYGVLAVSAISIAHADTLGNVTINGTDNVYAPAGAGAGSAPTAIAVTGGSYITFNSATGTITLNDTSGNNFNDPDGIGSVSSAHNDALGSFSGIDAPNAGYLAGVFVPAGGPAGAAPGDLDFTGAGGTAFASLTPLLDQVFFIGDGLTGDGTGSTQQFFVPTGAGTLYLGIADACGYNGPATGCYDDNSGTFNINYDLVPADVSLIPEPSSLLLFGTGILGAAGAFRRRFHTA